MRRIVPAFIAVLIAGGIIGYAARAQQGSPANNGVPEIVTYRGYLEDSSTGTSLPVSGNKPMIFTLFTAASGGSAVWTCGPIAVPVLGGHFEAQLGGAGCPFTGAAGPEKLFNRDGLYLEITVDSTVLGSRQRLTSAPYAIASSQSDNFRVNGALIVDGATTLAGGLTVNGNSIHTGGLTVSGGTTSLQTGAAITGNATVSSALTVNGQTNMNGGAGPHTVNGGLTVTGQTNLNGGTNAHTVNGALTVTGQANLNGGTNGHTVNGNLHVTGDITNFGHTTIYSVSATGTSGANVTSFKYIDLNYEAVCFLVGFTLFDNSGGNSDNEACNVTLEGVAWKLTAVGGRNGNTLTCRAMCITW